MNKVKILTSILITMTALLITGKVLAQSANYNCDNQSICPVVATNNNNPFTFPTVTIPEEGDYLVSYSVTSQGEGKDLFIYIDGDNVNGESWGFFQNMPNLGTYTKTFFYHFDNTEDLSLIAKSLNNKFIFIYPVYSNIVVTKLN